MRFTEEIQEQIIDLSFNSGLSSRAVAKILNISKSGVNDFLAKCKLGAVGYPKVLFFDLETAPDITATFGRWNVNITPANVIQEGDWLLSASWSWLGDPNVYSSVISPSAARRADDSKVVEAMLNQYNKADIVIAHNGKRFDVPMLRTRALLNGFPPPRNVRVIDTLTMAKKLSFRSNKLDNLGKRLDVGRKIQNSGISLWIDCILGDRVALEKMREYNAVDVQLLKDVYHELAPFDTSTPNFATYFKDDTPRCRTCGSTKLVPTGKHSYTNLGKFAEVACQQCGTVHRSRVNKLTKKKRASLFA